MTILLFALLASAPIPIELGPAWAEFSRVPSTRMMKTQIDVGTLGDDRARKQLDFWLRRTTTGGIRQQEQVTWADTRTCPAARPLLASMRDISVPKFAPVGSSKGPPVTLDGVGYSLRTYSDQGMLTDETNAGTPLAVWIDSALKTLAPCWTAGIPERTR